MRRFAQTYPDFEIGQQAVAQITWSHNILLMQKCDSMEKRLRYAQQAVENGWSRNVMVHHIESKLYERQNKPIANYSSTLPAPQSDLANNVLKDPYLFNFLNLSKEAKEKELEDAIVKHITKFLVELGT